MTEPEHHQLDSDLDRELYDRRPLPRRPFEDRLRDRLRRRDVMARRPEHLQPMVWAYLASGLLLLLLAALSAGGGGPFG